MDEKRRRRGKVTSFYKPILERIDQLAQKAKAQYSRPTALMLAFGFTELFDDYPITGVIDKLRDKLRKPGKKRKKNNTFNIKYLWCRELKYIFRNDPEFESLSPTEQAFLFENVRDCCGIPYRHYHILVFLDAKKATHASVKFVMDNFVTAGIVRPNFHISRNNITKIRDMHLDSAESYQEFFYNASYLAKTDTKPLEDKRFWGSSSIN